MWNTIESLNVWMNAFVKYFRDLHERQLALNQPINKNYIEAETDYGYIEGRVDFDENTTLVSLSNQRDILYKPLIQLKISSDIYFNIDEKVYFPKELDYLSIKNSLGNYVENKTKFIFLGNTFKTDDYIIFYSLDTLVILESSYISSKIIIKKSYFKNLVLTCNNVYINNCLIENLHCDLNLYLLYPLDAIVLNCDLYSFETDFHPNLVTLVDNYYIKAKGKHILYNSSYHNIYCSTFNLCSAAHSYVTKVCENNIKDALENDTYFKNDILTFYICNEDDFQELITYEDIFYEDYKEKIEYMFKYILKVDVSLVKIKNGFKFMYLNLFEVRILFFIDSIESVKYNFLDRERKKWENIKV